MIFKTQTRRSNQSILKLVLGVHWKDWCWGWNSNIVATSWEELTHWKRPWCWEGLGAGGEGDDRGWDGWMASPTRWTWVWVNSGSWWWTGRPGVLWFMGSQRVGHSWTTELNWTENPFMLRNLRKPRNRKKIPQDEKVIWKSTPNNTLNDKILNFVILWFRSKQRCLITSLLFSILLVVPASTVKQELKNKRSKTVKKLYLVK